MRTGNDAFPVRFSTMGMLAYLNVPDRVSPVFCMAGMQASGCKPGRVSGRVYASAAMS